MCFVCSQPEGFDTDISKIIGLSKNTFFKINRKEVTPITNEKIYLSIKPELNQTFGKSKSINSDELNGHKLDNKVNRDYQIKMDSKVDDFTGKTLLKFSGESLSDSSKVISAMIETKVPYDQVTGLNTDDARMFRLYNAAFKRLPDSDGLKYWIEKYSSGENDERTVASSFLGSVEFAKRYGSDISDEKYVRTLYQNVLDRAPDYDGMNYWLGQLTSGAETRNEVLLGFAESEENKALFFNETSLIA